MKHVAQTKTTKKLKTKRKRESTNAIMSHTGEELIKEKKKPDKELASLAKTMRPEDLSNNHLEV
jgi:hypothetical protein